MVTIEIYSVGSLNVFDIPNNLTENIIRLLCVSERNSKNMSEKDITISIIRMEKLLTGISSKLEKSVK